MKLGEFHEIIIEVPWGHIAGRWYGDQLQRPLVALHDWLDNCGTFARLAPLLSSYTSLLCIDLPGHGHSSHLPNGILYNPLDYVYILLHLMKTYEWNKISLMGHSLGALIGFIFASFYPNRIDLLIGLDGLINHYMQPKIEINILNELMEKLLIENERHQENKLMNESQKYYTYSECVQLLYEGSKKSVEKDNCKYLLERNVKKSKKYPDKYYFSRDSRLKNIHRFNTPNEMVENMVMRFGRNAVPYLIIKSGTSNFINANIISDIVPVIEKLNKNFEFHVIEGVTHHLHLNNPHEIADLIIEFWKRKGWRNALNDRTRNNSASDVESKCKEVLKSKL